MNTTNSSPMRSLWKGFKVGTIAFAQIYGIAFIVAGVLLLNVPVFGIMLITHGGFSYWCGKSINKSLAMEELMTKAEDDYEDQDPPNTLRPV